jgi:hypothetical protein
MLSCGSCVRSARLWHGNTTVMGIMLAVAVLLLWQRGFEDLMPQMAVRPLGMIEVWLGGSWGLNSEWLGRISWRPFRTGWWAWGKVRITLTEGLRDCRGGDAGHSLCLNYMVAFSLPLSKNTKNVNLGSRKVLGTVHCGDLAAFIQVAWTSCLFPVAFD